MFSKLTDSLSTSAQTLQLRAHRQEVLTSNIANVDTPNYKAVDFDFKSALQQITQGNKPGSPVAGNVANGLATTHKGHLGAKPQGAMSTAAMLEYRRNINPAMDNNTVDIEKERAAYAENAVKYEVAVRQLNGKISSLKTAMGTGQ